MNSWFFSRRRIKTRGELDKKTGSPTSIWRSAVDLESEVDRCNKYNLQYAFKTREKKVKHGRGPNDRIFAAGHFRRSGGARRQSSRACEMRIFNLVPRLYYKWEASHFCEGKAQQKFYFGTREEVEVIL